MSRGKAVGWIVATALTPLSVSLLCVNVYIAWWYYRMEVQGTPHGGPPPIDVIQQALIYTAGCGLWVTVGLWWLLKRKESSFSELFRTKTSSPVKDVSIGFGVGVFWVLVYGLLGWPRFSDMLVFDVSKLVSMPTSLSAGFCEEFLFRGFVIGVIAKTGGGGKARVIWSSVAFGAAHFHWGPVGALFTFFLGLSFATVTLARRNVWSAVTAHSLLNLCIEPALLEKAMAFHRGWS